MIAANERALYDEAVAIHNNPERYAKTFLRIKTKAMVIQPLIYNPVQCALAKNLVARNLILKSRQLGCSTWIQALFHQVVTTQTAASLTLADVDVNTQKLRHIYNLFYEQWPEHFQMWRAPRAQDSIVRITYPKTNSVSEIITAGAKTAGRAGTYSHLHVSEAAFLRDAETTIAGVMQAVTPAGLMIWESTPNGAQGKFFEWCMEALDGNSLWRLHFFPWWWEPEYRAPLDIDETITFTDEELQVIAKARAGGFELTQEQIKWRRNKQRDIPLTFAQEYPEDPYSCFLKSGASVFGQFDGCLKQSEQTDPNPAHRYVAGIDWGLTEDYTALSIMDATAGEEVYLNRWRRLSPETVIALILDACSRWRVEKIRPELNSIGTINVNLLSKHLEERDDYDASISGFMTTNESKRLMVDNMAYGIRNDILSLLPIDYATSELRTFTQTQTAAGIYRYDHIAGAKSDTVIARMAAYDAVCNLIW